MYGLLGMDTSAGLSGMLEFFLADTIKILLLLFVMIAVIGFFRSFVSQERLKRWLSGRRSLLSHFAASAFGSVTPFCSCSSIPIFFSFLKAGIPLGVSFSFLITSPIVNEYLVVLMFAFFGWKITAAYVLSGIILGVIAGMALGRMGLERYLEKDMRAVKTKDIKFSSWKDRVKFGIDESWGITRKIWYWVVIGVGVGAIIHNYVPQSLIEQTLGRTGWLAVPLAVIVGVPIYGSCAAIVPIAVALLGKGVQLGTTLVFMMAVAALSLPEAIILRRAMKLKLILIFFGIVTLLIIFTGYLFNFLQPLLI